MTHLPGADLLLLPEVVLHLLHLDVIDPLQGPLPGGCVAVQSADVLHFPLGAVLRDVLVVLQEGLHSADAVALLFVGLFALVQDLFHRGEAEHQLQDVGGHQPTLDHLVHARYPEGYQEVVVLGGL